MSFHLLSIIDIRWNKPGRVSFRMDVVLHGFNVAYKLLSYLQELRTWA